jgi:hypothetical protein
LFSPHVFVEFGIRRVFFVSVLSENALIISFR